MSDWFQPEYVLSGIALLVALIALWFSWSSARQANRAADDAEASKNAAERSARAASQSSEMLLEFVDLPVSRWLETKTALLCIQDIRRIAVSSRAASRPAPPGFTFDLRNRGKAAASDIVVGLIIDGVAQSWETSIPVLNPGAAKRIRFPFTDRRYFSQAEFTILVRYQDTEMHDAVFVLEKTPGELDAPRLIGASLDGGRHPGHLTLLSQGGRISEE